MGRADRDNMRERYTRRQGLRWNDKRGRVEYDEAGVLASHRLRRPRVPSAPGGGGPLQQLLAIGLLLACAVLMLIWWALSDYLENNRRGFPESGSVTVSDALSPKLVTARLGIKTGRDHAIIQLLTPETASHVLSIYMRPNDRRMVPVPPGVWRLRIISGGGWVGPRKLFGDHTLIKLQARPFVVPANARRVIDLSGRSADAKRP